MYLTVEMVPVIGLFGLVVTAAGWARLLYLGARRSDPICGASDLRPTGAEPNPAR